MKHLAASLLLTIALAGCVSSAEIDKDQAWAECEKLLDKASRSSCMTNALSNANAERRANDAAAEQAQQDLDKAIEDKAAIEQAHGVPEDKTGTTIVREPFE